MIERYTLNEMKDLFSDENRFNAYLKVEVAAAKAYSDFGVVPKDAALLIEKNARVDVERIKEIEAITRHDVIAFTRQISETLGDERRYVHYGLTSTDVVDTAMSILYKEANDIIESKLDLLLDAIKKKAMAYKDTPCIGRTHGMHAEIISFGFKWANYYDEIRRGILDFKTQRKCLEVCKLSGAVGTYADNDPRLQKKASEYLGLECIPVATQVISRDRHEHYASSLTILASTMEKIATEIRNLSRTEIHEVEEGFKKGQKGSSAMPQKRNPIASENICGCARMIRGYLLPILEDNSLYHERDISHSSVERVCLIDMITLFAYMTDRLTKVINDLAVFPERMLDNIRLSNSSVFASRVLSALIDKGMTREEAYDLIQPSAMKAALAKSDFKEELKNDEKVSAKLNSAEIDSCFDMSYYLRHIDYIYKELGLL